MNNPWMQTYTGLAAHPLNLEPEQITIEDIAHSLALTCRFRGHCRTFYSVAQHSVLACQQAPAGLKRAALLHDAAETYTGDTITPVKGLVTCNGMSMDEHEYAITSRIFETFGVPLPSFSEDELIKRIDNRLVMTEARDLLTPPPMPWDVDAEPYDFKIVPWPWEVAERRFLGCFRCLYERGEEGIVCERD